ncbi:MAG: DMT family transporter [Chromatiales bacterium]|nr:DMT family transporter [Chromatiales bacterium]
MPLKSTRGIGFMLVAVACFAGMDAVLKVLSTTYPALQVGALRGASSLPFVLASVAVTRRWRELRVVRWELHLVRGVLALIMLWGFVTAVSVLSLADAYAIFFIAPLIVTAVAVPLLKEHVDWRRWVAIGVGLSGVLWMLQPGGSTLNIYGAIGALAAAVAYALASVSVRVMTKTESTVSLVFWFLVLLTLFAGVLALPGWVPIRGDHWPWLALLGVFGALGQHFITEAFRHAPASVIAPFEYTAMLWAVAIDWVFWSTWPGSRIWLGAALVVACGLYLIWRERQLHHEVVAAGVADTPVP